jgi:hypothetical protein
MRTSLLAVALTGTLLAGCAGNEPAPAAGAGSTPVSASPSATPSEQSARDELQAALAVFRTTTYKYTLTGEYWPKEKILASGSRDPTARRAAWTVKITGGEDAESTRHVVIAGDRYRASGTGGWKADTTVSAKDPDGVARFAAAITTTQRTAPHTFKGSLFVAATGEKPSFIPLGAPRFPFSHYGMPDFTATTDAQGHVTTIVITMKTVDGPLKQTTTFSGFGAAVTITKPA